MSIYCTLFCLVYGDSEGYLGGPRNYHGSHVVPLDEHPQDGYVEIGVVADHIQDDYGHDGKDGSQRWMRLTVAESDHGEGKTVVLNVAQARAMHKALGAWLRRRVDDPSKPKPARPGRGEG